MIANMQEGEVTVDGVPIGDETEKFFALANLILPRDSKIDADDVEEMVWLVSGRWTQASPRESEVPRCHKQAHITSFLRKFELISRA